MNLPDGEVDEASADGNTWRSWNSLSLYQHRSWDKQVVLLTLFHLAVLLGKISCWCEVVTDLFWKKIALVGKILIYLSRGSRIYLCERMFSLPLKSLAFSPLHWRTKQNQINNNDNGDKIKKVSHFYFLRNTVWLCKVVFLWVCAYSLYT